MLYGKDDTFGRCVQGICAIFLALCTFVAGYYILHFPVFWGIIGGFAVSIGCARLCWRCAKYALTGEGNVNRDDFL
jgi:hypothetical protein